MRAYFAILMLAICYGTNMAHADTTPATDNNNAIMQYKLQLFNELNTGSIFDNSFDKQTEINIAQTQLQLAKAYMDEGDRKLALILGILARQTMQRALNNPYDPAMIPIYSILVQLYDSNIDNDAPNKDQADATQSKLYREAIDHIHSR